jgi:hypothetical protein
MSEDGATESSGGGAGGGDEGEIDGKAGGRKRVVVTRLERNRGDEELRRDSTWLGVGADEADEALAAQLQLQNGEGLVVTFVSSNSPAAKAGIKKNDVLVKFDDQVLVHPAQLRKLVQSRKEGDRVEITTYRRGEKVEMTATLEKSPAGFAFALDDRGWQGNMDELKRKFEVFPREGWGHLRESLAKAGVDTGTLAIEIRRSVQDARKAAEEALRTVTNAHQSLLRELAQGGVDIDKDTHVEVRSTNRKTRNMVRTDDSGTYVLLANPKKHLTVHDKDGNLLFDGPVETEKEQEKVPKDVWDKAKKMVNRLDSPSSEQPEAEDDEDINQ